MPNKPTNEKTLQRQPQGFQKTTRQDDSIVIQTNGKKALPIVRIGKKRCDEIRAEVAAAGLSLDSAKGDAQLIMLPRVMRYFGARGLATVEAEALGYRRIATRIQDLEAAGYKFYPAKEHVITDDQLLHPRMARYVLLREPTDKLKASSVKPKPCASGQQSLGF